MVDLPRDLPSTLMLAGHVLDLHSRELRCRDDGSLVPLRRQALEVLLVLAERAGHVVEKQTLMQRVWRDVVVGDDSLAQAIVEIRRALGDEGHRLVRTVARRGYLLTREPVSASAATPAIPPMAIAVLPIDCEEQASADDRRCAALLTAELTARVGRGQTGLRVIAHGTARAVGAIDPREAASRLGVHHIVCGQWRSAGDGRRVAVAMIDGDSGVQRWVHEFAVERSCDGRLADTAARIARALLVEMHHAAGERALGKPDASRSAEDLALLGWSHVYRGLSAPNLERALGWFRAALGREPTNCRGLGGVACVGVWLTGFGWADDPQAVLREVRDAAAVLAAVHPEDTLARLARASVDGLHGDHASQLTIAEQLIERNPGNPSPHMLRARALLRAGRAAESLAASRRAFELSVDDFRAPLWDGVQAQALLMLGANREAAEAARRSIAANACLPLPPLCLAAALAGDGHETEARTVLQAYLQRAPGFTTAKARELMGTGAPAFVEAAESMLRRLQALGLH